ncbi:MAG: polyamine aminopropyltransferase [Planctomycetota bacterium]
MSDHAAHAGYAGAPAPSRGFFDGAWFTEEKPEVSRLGLRVASKLHEEQSAYQKITVYDTAFFGRLLTLDDLVMFTERDEFVYHEMLLHVPLLSLPAPRSVLIIGGGDCGCLREALRHPSIERVVQCEIDERVTAVCRDWFPWVDGAARDPRADLVFDDGVRYLDTRKGEFDLVVIDSTDPIGPAAPLFERGFYGAVARALKPGGVMTAQTEPPHWSPELVGRIYRELRAAFSHVAAYFGTIPTYPSGSWTWAYASRERRRTDFFDAARAETIAGACRYYHPALQEAAFVLPTLMRRAVEGEDPFRGIERLAR